MLNYCLLFSPYASSVVPLCVQSRFTQPFRCLRVPPLFTLCLDRCCHHIGVNFTLFGLLSVQNKAADLVAMMASRGGYYANRFTNCAKQDLERESVGHFVISCRFFTPRTLAASGATLQTRDFHRSAGTSFIWGFTDRGVSSVLLSFLKSCYIGLLLVVLQLIDGMSFFSSTGHFNYHGAPCSHLRIYIFFLALIVLVP